MKIQIIKSAKVKRAVRLTAWVISVILGLVVAAFGFIRFSPDFDIMIVRSDSMTPTFQAGDLIVTGPVNQYPTGSLESGKIITFKRLSDTITHRVEAINGEKIVTRGDALDHADTFPVTTADVQGIYMFKIPYVGLLLAFAKSRMGFFATVLVPSAILVIILVVEILREAFKTETKKAGGTGSQGSTEVTQVSE